MPGHLPPNLIIATSDMITDCRQTEFGDPLRTHKKSLQLESRPLSPFFGLNHQPLQSGEDGISPSELSHSNNSSPPQALPAVTDLEAFISCILTPELAEGFFTTKTDEKSDKPQPTSAKVAIKNDHVPAREVNPTLEFNSPAPRVGIFPNTIAFLEAAAAADAAVVAANAAVTAAPSSAPKPLRVHKRKREVLKENEVKNPTKGHKRENCSPRGEDVKKIKHQPLPYWFNKQIAQGKYFLPLVLNSKYTDHLKRYGIMVTKDRKSDNSVFLRKGLDDPSKISEYGLFENLRAVRFLICRDFFHSHPHFSKLEYLNLLNLEPLKIQNQDWYVVQSCNPDCQSMTVSDDAIRHHFSRLHTEHKLAESIRIVALSGQLFTLAQHDKQPGLVGIAFKDRELAIAWCNCHGGLSVQLFNIPMPRQDDSKQVITDQKGRVSHTSGTVFNPHIVPPVKKGAEKLHRLAVPANAK